MAMSDVPPFSQKVRGALNDASGTPSAETMQRTTASRTTACPSLSPLAAVNPGSDVVDEVFVASCVDDNDATADEAGAAPNSDAAAA